VSSRDYLPASRAESIRQHDAETRSAATVAAVLGLLFGLAPVVITLAAFVLGPLVPYPVGSLVSLALVAACVALAIFFGLRDLRLVRETQAQVLPLRGWAGEAAARTPDRALAVLRAMGIAGIVLGALHGVFLIGSLALTVPSILWLMSVHG
jgi:hypothetical protein